MSPALSDPRTQALLADLDLAAYLARHGQPARRHRALALAERARGRIGPLAAEDRVAVLEAAAEVERLARRSGRQAQRQALSGGAALAAALVGGVLLTGLLQLAWDEAERRLDLPEVVATPGAPDRVATFVVLAAPGGTPGATDDSPGAPQPPAPAPAPSRAEAPPAAPRLDGLPDPAAPPVGEPAPALAEAEADTGAPDPLAEDGVGDTGGAPDALPTDEPDGGATRAGLRLPGGGTSGAFVALPREAPMAFHAIGPVSDGRRGAPLGLQVARTEVTQAQWQAVMGMDLATTSGHWEHPAEALSWCDALRYANALSTREGLRPAYRVGADCEAGGTVRWDTRADGFRLLTEEEWLALAEASGPPPSPPPPTRRGEQNNRGVGRVDAARTDAEYGLAGVADNVREWVWGGPPGAEAGKEVERWQAHDTAHARSVVRGCGTFSEVLPTPADPWCRADEAAAQAPLGVGLRLARGRLQPEV